MEAPPVLIATDLTDSSRVAEAKGAALARAFSAPVVLLHCYNPEPQVPPIVIPSPARMEAAIEREMHEAIEKGLRQVASERFFGIDVQTEARRTENAAAGICAYAEEHGVSFIVVGTHGRKGLRRALIGSVAERVVRHAPCSVVVARPERTEPFEEGGGPVSPR